ncbi:host attachment family protein [Rhodalgimonas zhirmunskyi]|uniref:Host attachment family protein n=1 Tax=Rhodalgimonas zhirmunskyi TaxID=2964767 RepID=A0AAJ1U584_9RHOB|nr:host attachment family protein [Rhodoalgimonas zhirmunskyi]MDQ2093865.1 host attachment family protein [Rhodoalgimonas zhirmunskyi]
MTKLKQDTLIVVADGEKVLFLRNLTDHQNPNFEVTGKEEQDNPPDRAQGTDKPGRMPDTGHSQRSGLDETDWHELAKERFAADLADMLYERAHKGEFERLVLVASPPVLGELRDKMHKEVSDRVVAEIPKTLTNHPVNEIEKLVKQEMASD